MRQRAADDFDAIGKRLRELQGQPPSSDEQQFDTRNVTKGGERLTREEALAVAKMYNCGWYGASAFGCGRNVSKDCLERKACVYQKRTP